jgi:hypothetical protein
MNKTDLLSNHITSYCLVNKVNRQHWEMPWGNIAGMDQECVILAKMYNVTRHKSLANQDEMVNTRECPM